MDSPLPLPTDLYVPTQDERTMATLAHALQMIGGWIAPLIIFFTKRDSKFVSFHALQVLLFQMCYLGMVMIFGAIFFVTVFATVLGAAAQGHSQQAPFAFFIVFPLFWLAMMAGGVLTLILAIVYAMKANRGEWAEIPVVGKWAKHILHV